MDICPPAIATSALFVAVLLLDLYLHEWGRVPGHAILGAFTVLVMMFICQRGSASMAWILLGAPFVFLVLAWIARAYSEMTTDDSVSQPAATWQGGMGSACGCPCCGSSPCHCMRPCPQQQKAVTCKPKPKCKPKNPPCSDDSYFELWLTTK
jgi:hypothetical protein